jgi:hypothetical protein
MRAGTGGFAVLRFPARFPCSPLSVAYEATNFVKFFRREAGLTPGAFRTRQASS